MPHVRTAAATLALAALFAHPVLAGGVWPTTGWATSTPEAQGMDSALLAQARDFALTGAGSGIITRGGYSVMTWGSQSSRRELKSATKSIGITLLGLAIDDGLVALEDSALGHYADFGTPPAANETTGWLADITFRDLATHAAGFDKAGGYIALENAPGTTWQYSDGGANWIADVLTVRFAEDLHDVLFGRVLTPLGITTNDFRWRDHASRSELIQGVRSREFGSGMTVDVDAMARIGYLYLRRGDWNGTRILSESFVTEATTAAPSIAGLTIDDPAKYSGATAHYGLLWWNNADGAIADVPTDTYWAWGLNENLIIVMPSLDVVVARGSATGWRSGWSADYAVIAPFLQPIAQAVTSLSTDPGPSWGSLKSQFRNRSANP
ncbi:MAG: hypothetical protein DHS20C21_12110 [Gemmatimonadota bacterium]|nr:MAG: hypothetical protein DHS20C21_12110 [Gemmatimonadota bacterium]